MSETLHRTMIDNNRMLQFFVLSKHKIYRHLIMIAFISLALYYSDPEYIEPIETYSRIIALMLFLILVYINMYLLVPKLLFKSQYALYGLSVLFIIGVAAGIYLIGWHYFGPYTRPGTEEEKLSVLPFSFVIIVVVCASAAIKLFQRWMLDAELIHELEQAKTTAELEQLKNQINPHFLFNMLNNANVLTKKDPDKASQVLMKLSDLLRYQLYDSSREKVLLTSDIHFLEDFLNLEKVRRDNFDFIISKEGDLSGIQIPPLLFISFVENATKHNNDAAKSSYVQLFFNVNNNVLYFKCINSKPILKAVHTSGGLGLANIKRRLELLFPASHDLKIGEDPETYSVTLSIRL